MGKLYLYLLHETSLPAQSFSLRLSFPLADTEVHLTFSVVSPSSKRSLRPCWLQALIMVCEARSSCSLAAVDGDTLVFRRDVSTPHFTAATK